MKAVDRQTIEILRTVDTPTVCNAIELFKIRAQNEGFLHHAIHSLFPELPPMVGHAVTCTFRSARMGKGVSPYADIGKHVEALLAVPEPRVMVFQDLDGEPVGASFGEMLAATYMAFGCVGIVTSGGARDTPAIRERKLPLFARSKNCSHGYPQYLTINTPIEVGGVTIRPGDLLHGDADGLTTVPNDRAPRIAAVCRRFLGSEKQWAEYVDGGRATAAGVSRIVAEHKKRVADAMKEDS